MSENDFSRRPRRRDAGHPIRAFRESHPTVFRSVLLFAVVVAVAVLTAQRFLR